MAEGYETFILIWAGISVEISHQANWLNSGYWHIELRCDEPLPVTETGYRSYFVPMPEFSDGVGIRDCVTDWLDAAADRPIWQKYLEDSKQLKLF